MRKNLQLVSPPFLLLQTLKPSVVRSLQTSFQSKLNSSKLQTNETSTSYNHGPNLKHLDHRRRRRRSCAFCTLGNGL